MQRLDVDCLDFYQIWNIDSKEHYHQATQKGGMLDGIFRAMKEGLVKHTGFTTHDKPENVSGYIDEAGWCEAILFTYNMLDRTYEDVIAKAHEKGIATVVMNPIAGGLFTYDSPPIENAIKKTIGIDSPVEAAHRWLKTNKNIDTIICGISKPSDIMSTIENYEKPVFTVDQLRHLNAEFAKMSKQSTGFCVDCKYCIPCPAGINIPDFMHAAYYSEFLNVFDKAGDIYKWQLNSMNQLKSADPDECTECGKCETKCTQKIKIIQMLKTLKSKLGHLKP
jgi:predicted aldo/keto reductase-like oxidoreductase